MDRLGDPWRVRKHEEPRMCGGREGPFATFAYNTATTLSPILGFGGAFTQAASLNFHALSSTGQDAALELLFGKTGLGYNLGRTHINSCDFSTASFDFDGIDGDFDLEDFGGVKERDGGEVIDFVKRAMGVLKDGWGDDVLLLASPWSPPAWMKKNTTKGGTGHADSMLGSAPGTCLRDGVGRDSMYADVWARYMSRWVKEYENAGAPIWGITVQNEPEFAAPWEACSFNETTERTFVENHLGPVFRRDNEGVKIIGFDHNKDHAVKWANELKKAGAYIDGIGYHWYAGGMDRLLDGGVGTPNMHRLREATEGIVLGTEGCHCPSTGYAGGDKKVAWKRAERNAHALLGDLAAGSGGNIEWNLILDKLGGPNHLGNMCDSPIVTIPDRTKLEPAEDVLPGFERGVKEGEVIVGDTLSFDDLVQHGGVKEYMDVGVLTQPMYWVMGHFTRYLRKGSMAAEGILDGRRVWERVKGRGGENDNARVGFEATFFPCEGSTRQMFVHDGVSGEIKTRDYSKEGKGGFVCLGEGNDVGGFEGVLLVKCDDKLEDGEESKSGKYHVHEDTEEIQEGKTGECLGLKELEGRGHAIGVRGGSQLVLEECGGEVGKQGKQKLVFDTKKGELRETNLNVCLTTGWPFLQAGSFVNQEGKTILLVLNEGEGEVEVTIENGEFLLDIEGHSIVTVLIK